MTVFFLAPGAVIVTTSLPVGFPETAVDALAIATLTFLLLPTLIDVGAVILTFVLTGCGYAAVAVTVAAGEVNSAPTSASDTSRLETNFFMANKPLYWLSRTAGPA